MLEEESRSISQRNGCAGSRTRAYVRGMDAVDLGGDGCMSEGAKGDVPSGGIGIVKQ